MKWKRSWRRHLRNNPHVSDSRSHDHTGEGEKGRKTLLPLAYRRKVTNTRLGAMRVAVPVFIVGALALAGAQPSGWPAVEQVYHQQIKAAGIVGSSLVL